jgi:hypothetical protein
LLILDSYRSHLTFEFIQYYMTYRILLLIYPPYSTHSLQPLDVVMFKPLSSQYSAKLTTFIHKSMGLLNLKKDDFFGLFWAAWMETILKSFEACGIWPKNSERVLKRFTQQPLSKPEHPGTPDLVPESDWKKTRASVIAVVKEGAEKEAKQLIHSLHHFQV